MFRRVLLALAIALGLGVAVPGSAQAADFGTWNEIVDEMEAILLDAEQIFADGDAEAAKNRVDDAYFGYYELLGFERAVMSYISGDRATTVEYQFAHVKRSMLQGGSHELVSADVDALIVMLREDADRLDGKEESAAAVFGASLAIILREGVEAIIIVGAIIAYLVKSGHSQKLPAVYWGSALAVVASIALAILLNALTGLSGANQEIIEGATILLAVAVLVYVSNWVLSKAEIEAWEGYLEEKTQKSMSSGSVFSLAFVAFLAVFREGAETILFYQALLAQTATHVNMIWIGLVAGSVALVVVYLLIRFLSIKLPLKPFFVATSAILAVMAVTFLGSGIKELQEGNVISVTPIEGMRSIDLLGIYPTYETFVPQVLLTAFLAAMFVLQHRKSAKFREAARAKAGPIPAKT